MEKSCKSRRPAQKSHRHLPGSVLLSPSDLVGQGELDPWDKALNSRLSEHFGAKVTMECCSTRAADRL
eukprot:767305-Hanusia_phi.AAC.5